MSTTATHLQAPPTPHPPPPPAATAARVQPRRRRPGLIAFGVLAVVLGALGASFLVLSLGTTHQVLAIARPVEIGTKLTNDDLKIVDINAAPGLKPIPASDRAKIVGRYAKVDLVPDTLLTADHLTEAIAPHPGQQLLGIGVKPSQLPARALKPGDSVLLVVTPDPRNISVDPKASSPPSLSGPPTFRATVMGSSKPQSDGQLVVDVVVSATDGPGIVVLASQGRIAIVLVPKD